MERAERLDDPVEAQRLALEGQQAQIWTALPGLVTAFDPVAMTVSVQPAVQGSITGEDGKSRSCSMPLLVDVPVVFPCGGGFTLTHPIKAGDEALVVFSSRCIDGWWQGGKPSPPPDGRMHDLSDGMAIVGMRSQARKLDPPVDPENVQLRTDDGKASITVRPDHSLELKNENFCLNASESGAVTLDAGQSLTINTPVLNLLAAAILMQGNVTTQGAGGEAGTFDMRGHINLEGGMDASQDVTAEGVSTAHHTHVGDSGGHTREPDK